MVYGGDRSVLILRGLVDRDRWWRHPHCPNHVEVWVPGVGVYAVILANTESTAVGESTHDGNEKPPGNGGSVCGVAGGLVLRLDGEGVFEALHSSLLRFMEF
jgi:hypothetical protein